MKKKENQVIERIDLSLLKENNLLKEEINKLKKTLIDKLRSI